MVIITLPAFNEEAALPALLLRIEEAMREAGFEYRVIVVNDGSSDGTGAAVDSLRGKLPVERSGMYRSSSSTAVGSSAGSATSRA